MKLVKYILLAITLLVILPTTFAADITIKVEEVGDIITFYDEYFIVDLNGTVTITNPTTMDIMGMSIPLEMSTLKFKMTNSTNGIEEKFKRIYIPFLGANATESFDYTIVGITSNGQIASKKGVFQAAIVKDNVVLSSQSAGTLFKAPLEDPSEGGHINTRLISAVFNNPTTFNYTVYEVKIIKTGQDMNLNNELNSWTFQKEDQTLQPGETWNIDFLDRDAFEGEIYWLTSDMNINQISYKTLENITIIKESELFAPIENVTNVTENVSSLATFLSEQVFLRKTISKNVVNPGEIIDVTILMNNFGADAITKAELTDLIPKGFEFYNPKQGSIKENQIQWNDILLNPRETRKVSYQLKYVDNESLGLDYFDAAELAYKNKRVYSQVLTFVRSYLPERKLFVQKTIEFISDENVRVTLTLQNMGEADIDHIVMNEYLAEESEFKEITKEFDEKGVWKIDKIKLGDTWEVSYVTDTVGVLNTFPTVYGIEEKSILKTVILSNIIQTKFIASSFKVIEALGILALLAGIVVVLLPANYFFTKNKKQIKRLKDYDSEIEKLITDMNPKKKKQSNIDITSTRSSTETSKPKATQISAKDAEERKARQEMINSATEQMNSFKDKINPENKKE